MSEIEAFQAAIDELEREKAVRIRCYDNWINQKKLSVTEARDRMDRLQWSIRYLRNAQDLYRAEHVQNNHNPPPDPIPTPLN